MAGLVWPEDDHQTLTDVIHPHFQDNNGLSDANQTLGAGTLEPPVFAGVAGR